MTTRSDAIIAAIGGPLFGLLILWAQWTNHAPIPGILAKSPIPEPWTGVIITCLAWIFIGFLPTGIFAVVFGEDHDRDDYISLGIFIWIFGSLAAVAALWASCFVGDVFHVSFGMLLISWLLFFILIALIVIALRIGRSTAV